MNVINSRLSSPYTSMARAGPGGVISYALNDPLQQSTDQTPKSPSNPRKKQTQSQNQFHSFKPFKPAPKSKVLAKKSKR